jgi:hypothetical protein
MTLNTKPEQQTSNGDRHPMPVKPERPVSMDADLADVRRLVGFPGGQASGICREE